jgi:hypothetical protein
MRAWALDSVSSFVLVVFPHDKQQDNIAVTSTVKMNVIRA